LRSQGIDPDQLPDLA